jgi:plastocyanin
MAGMPAERKEDLLMTRLIRAARTTAIVLGVVVGVLFTVAGCSSGTGGGNAPTSGSVTSSVSAPDTIIIKNFMFSPMTLTVSSGAKVTVMNKDSAAHTVTASGDKKFDTGDVGPGKTATFTAPTQPGSYGYICDIHQYMSGTLVVK